MSQDSANTKESRNSFNEDREKAFQEFKHERGRDANGESFSWGWHSRDEEVKRLRSTLEILSTVGCQLCHRERIA